MEKKSKDKSSNSSAVATEEVVLEEASGPAVAARPVAAKMTQEATPLPTVSAEITAVPILSPEPTLAATSLPVPTAVPTAEPTPTVAPTAVPTAEPTPTVAPTPVPTFVVGGVVRNLSHSQIQLQIDGNETVVVPGAGLSEVLFHFSLRQTQGSSYSVTIKSQPQSPALSCHVNDGEGVVSAESVQAVVVICPQLNGLDIESEKNNVAIGTNLALHALAYYDFGVVDVTSFATWESTDVGVLGVNAAAVAVGVSAGSSLVKAHFGAFTADRNFTVSSAALSSVALSPLNPALMVGGALQLYATGGLGYAFGSERNGKSQCHPSHSGIVANLGAYHLGGRVPGFFKCGGRV